MKLKLHRLLMAALVAASISSAHAQGNLVLNGSFEGGYNNGPASWDWTYNVALASGFPHAADGRNWAEAYGTLSQTIATTPEVTYDLRFAMSGNFNISTPTVVDVQWGTDDLGTVNWNPSGHDINNLGWVWTELKITATTSSTLLRFENPFTGDDSGRIPKIDAVSVEAVPEPASVWLLSVGLVGIYGHRRASKVRRL